LRAATRFLWFSGNNARPLLIGLSSKTIFCDNFNCNIGLPSKKFRKSSNLLTASSLLRNSRTGYPQCSNSLSTIIFNCSGFEKMRKYFPWIDLMNQKRTISLEYLISYNAYNNIRQWKFVCMKNKLAYLWCMIESN